MTLPLLGLMGLAGRRRWRPHRPKSETYLRGDGGAAAR